MHTTERFAKLKKTTIELEYRPAKKQTLSWMHHNKTIHSNYRSERHIWWENENTFHKEKFTWAINSFELYKADSIIRIIIYKVVYGLLLTQLYSKCMEKNENFCYSKDRKNYSLRCKGPISLTSFLLKRLERYIYSYKADLR